MSDEKKQCPYYDVCKMRLHPSSLMEQQNLVVHLGFRFFYTLIAWFVLAFKVNDGFFLSMCFFALPVFMDCVKFTPLNKYRKIIRLFEIGVTAALFFISLLGVFGIYTLKTGENFRVVTENFIGVLPSDVPIQTFWIVIGLTVFVTLVDWLCNLFKLDDKVDEEVD